MLDKAFPCDREEVMPLDAPSPKSDARVPPVEGRVDLALEPDIRLGAMVVTPSAREVVTAGRREQLEPRIMQVLVRLARAPGVVVSREELIDSCWDGRIVGEDAINRVIAKLRRLSEADEGASFKIETIPRIGYRLWPQGIVEESGVRPAPVEQAPEAARTGLSRRPRWLVGLAAAAAAALLLAAATRFPFGGSPREPTLIVLPFQDLSPSGGQTYFAEGVAEEIQGVLASEPSIRVLGRMSSRRFSGETNLDRIRQNLDVSHVLEGSVQRGSSAVRLNVRLLRASDGAQVWAGRYERPPGDMLRTQQEVGVLVAQELGGALRPRSQPSGAAVVGAYDLVLAARQRLRTPGRDSLEAAKALLLRATEIDPGYGPAWAELAIVTFDMGNTLQSFGQEPAQRARAEAQRYAERAVALAPHRAESYASLGVASAGRPQAESLLRRAVAIDPSRTEFRIKLARELIRADKVAAAAQTLAAATQIDPFHPTAALMLADLQSRLGRHDDAERTVAAHEAVLGSTGPAIYARALIAADRGDWSEAVRLGEKVNRGPPGYRRTDALGKAYRVLNLSERARRLGSMTSQSFDVAVYARDDEAAYRRLAQSRSEIWDDPERRWMAVDLLARTGRTAELVAGFDQRFSDPENYCRTELALDAPTFVWALLKSNRRQEAELIRSCSEARLRREHASGLLRGSAAFSLAELSALSGRDQEALTWLERSWSEGYRGQYYSADPLESVALARLSGQPRFERVRRRLLSHIAVERSQVKM